MISVKLFGPRRLHRPSPICAVHGPCRRTRKAGSLGRDYNQVRPHSVIGYNVPITLYITGGVTSPSPLSEPESSSCRRSKVGDRAHKPKESRYEE